MAFFIGAIPYSKPKCRAEPSRRSDAFDKLQSCVNGRCNVIDQIWVLSRLLTRDIVELPDDSFLDRVQLSIV